MVDDPNKTESGSFMDDDYLSADDPAMSAAPKKVNIKEIFAQNPKLKVIGIVGGVIFLLLAYMVFGGDNSGKPDMSEEVSNVRSTPELSEAPGTAELPPAYEEAVIESNKQAVADAETTGGSVIPTPIARPSERIEAPVQVEENDPLSEWRREAETRRIERQQQEETAKITEQATLSPPPLPVGNDPNLVAQQQPQNPPLPTAPAPEQVQAIAQQLQQQMQIAIDAQVPTDPVMFSMNIAPGYDMKKYFPDNGATTAGTTTGGGSANANNAASVTNVSLPGTPPKPLIDAGTIAYAQTITEANSDVPGPVLAEVASGPLLGGRALGTFQVAQRNLVLQFNRIVKDGVEYQVQAFALDPGTTLPGVVSKIDNHYFSRVFLPAAAAFIQGFAEAATQQNNDVVVTNGTVVTSNQNDLDTREELLNGAQEAGNQISQVLQQNANRPRTVIVRAGTRIGLLFVNSVVDPTKQQPGTGYANGQSPGQTAFNASPYGQAYNAYSAYQQQPGQQQQQGYGFNPGYSNTSFYPGGAQQGQPQGLYSPPQSANNGLTITRTQPF